MNKEQFVNAYVVNFMATYTALHYTENCVNDKHYNIKSHVCVENALFLANYAWEAYEKGDGLSPEEIKFIER